MLALRLRPRFCLLDLAWHGFRSFPFAVLRLPLLCRQHDMGVFVAPLFTLPASQIHRLVDENEEMSRKLSLASVHEAGQTQLMREIEQLSQRTVDLSRNLGLTKEQCMRLVSENRAMEVRLRQQKQVEAALRMKILELTTTNHELAYGHRGGGSPMPTPPPPMDEVTASPPPPPSESIGTSGGVFYQQSAISSTTSEHGHRVSDQAPGLGQALQRDVSSLDDEIEAIRKSIEQAVLAQTQGILERVAIQTSAAKRSGAVEEGAGGDQGASNGR